MHPRLRALIEAHRRIDREVRLEQRRPWQDTIRISRLKKLRLRAKDLIRRFALQPAGA